MPETISEMTLEQQARIPEWIDKWTKIALSTERADFDKAEQAALKAYKLVGLEKPKIILHVSSPYEVVEQGYHACKFLNSQKKLVSKIESQIKSKIDLQIWLKVKSQISSQVWSQVHLQIRSQVWSQVWSQIKSQVWSQWSQDLMYNLYNSAFWTANCAFVSFFRDVLNWQDPILENFKIYEDLVISCGHVWWHENVLVISDRPKQIYQDSESRLHSASGPAISYRDGYSQWSWHGVFVPQVVIERPSEITIEMIERENNTEVRRIMIDRFGDKGAISYLLVGKNKILDHDERWGTLYRQEFKNDEPLVMVEVINRTPEADGSFKHYFLRVPSDITNAQQAVAWSFGKVPGKASIPGQRRQGDVLIERYESKEYYPESES